MLFERPHDDILYDALVARDAAYEGFAWAAVKTTGIFCRLTCPARKPKRENTTFYDTIAQCLEAGFRPCSRCRPMLKLGEADPMVTRLVQALDAEPHAAGARTTSSRSASILRPRAALSSGSSG